MVMSRFSMPVHYVIAGSKCYPDKSVCLSGGQPEKETEYQTFVRHWYHFQSLSAWICEKKKN